MDECGPGSSPSSSADCPIPSGSDDDYIEVDAGPSSVDWTDNLIVPSLPKIAGYDLKRLCGSGTFGLVYEAFNTPKPDSGECRLKIAVKVPRLTPESGRAAGLRPPRPDLRRKLFDYESKLLMRLGKKPHENFVHGIARGLTADGRPFVAMNYADGDTLRRQVLTEGGRHWSADLDARLDLAIQMADGVAELQERGVRIYDLKPENMVVDDNGRLKIVDLGVAEDALHDVDVRDTSFSSLMSGLTPGTRLYMSPEQLSGRPIRKSSQVYTLGLIIYELLSGGTRPFPDGHRQQDAIPRPDGYVGFGRRPVPPPTYPAGLPRRLPSRLIAVLNRALDWEPKGRRYSWAFELAEALRDVRRTPRQWQPYKRTAAITIAIVPFVAATTWRLSETREKLLELTRPPGHVTPQVQYTPQVQHTPQVQIPPQVQPIEVARSESGDYLPGKPDDTEPSGRPFGEPAVLLDDVFDRPNLNLGRWTDRSIGGDESRIQIRKDSPADTGVGAAGQAMRLQLKDFDPTVANSVRAICNARYSLLTPVPTDTIGRLVLSADVFPTTDRPAANVRYYAEVCVCDGDSVAIAFCIESWAYPGDGPGSKDPKVSRSEKDLFVMVEGAGGKFINELLPIKWGRWSHIQVEYDVVKKRYGRLSAGGKSIDGSKFVRGDNYPSSIRAVNLNLHANPVLSEDIPTDSIWFDNVKLLAYK